MAITITAGEMANALRVGDSTEERDELNRLLGVASAEIQKHLGDAFNDVDVAIVNQAALQWVGYAFDRPFASRGSSYANVLRNSGCGQLLLPYRVHRAGSTASDDDDDDTTTPSSGLVEIGDEVVDVTTAAQWTSTALPVPSTMVGGISVVPPGGAESTIELFRTANLTGTGVAGGSAEMNGQPYAIESTVGGVLLFASTETGTHTVRIYSYGV